LPAKQVVGTDVAVVCESNRKHEMTRTSVDLTNHHVEFRVSDIYLPDPISLLYELHSEELLNGRVIEMSDSGQDQGAFVVVDIEGIERVVVVPVDRVAVID